MNEDKILEMFFEKARWQYAIEKGLFKDMNKAVMYQLTTPEARLAMYQRIKSGNYKIMPPHTAKIPKDNGDFRTVYVNEPVDRILLSIANDLLFELMPEMVHPRCTSYQKGIGCGRVVQDVSRIIYSAEGKIIGWKGDFSKYFDSVPIRFVDWAFDKVEEKHGKSALIDVIRDYYHTDIYFDEDNNLCEKYQSLKQGCSVAAWLADVILYHLDDKLSKLNGYYVRYSDDTLFVGEDYEKAMDIMKRELEMMQMTLNPKKVEYLDANHWFKFLGYSIKGHSISLSSTRIKTFQKEIEKRTIKKRDTTMTKAINSVNRYLYKGYCDYFLGYSGSSGHKRERGHRQAQYLRHGLHPCGQDRQEESRWTRLREDSGCRLHRPRQRKERESQQGKDRERNQGVSIYRLCSECLAY